MSTPLRRDDVQAQDLLKLAQTAESHAKVSAMDHQYSRYSVISLGATAALATAVRDLVEELPQPTQCFPLTDATQWIPARYGRFSVAADTPEIAVQAMAAGLVAHAAQDGIHLDMAQVFEVLSSWRA